jgi:hypothetical protein
MHIFTVRWEGKEGGNIAEEMLISADESVMANFDLLHLFSLMQIFTARWEGKQGGNMAEEMLINSEACITADLDLLYRFPIYFNAHTCRQVGGQAGRQHGRGDAHQR